MSGHYARRNECPAVCGNPPCQDILHDFPCGKAKYDGGGGLLGSIKIDSVQPEKYDHRCQSRSLVAVDKCVISRDAESISCRENGKVRFAVSEFIDRPCERGFKETAIAEAIGAAEKRKLLGVEIENDIDVEPSRLAHLASAR